LLKYSGGSYSKSSVEKKQHPDSCTGTSVSSKRRKTLLKTLDFVLKKEGKGFRETTEGEGKKAPTSE